MLRVVSRRMTELNGDMYISPEVGKSSSILTWEQLQSKEGVRPDMIKSTCMNHEILVAPSDRFVPVRFIFTGEETHRNDDSDMKLSAIDMFLLKPIFIHLPRYFHYIHEDILRGIGEGDTLKYIIEATGLREMNNGKLYPVGPVDVVTHLTARQNKYDPDDSRIGGFQTVLESLLYDLEEEL